MNIEEKYRKKKDRINKLIDASTPENLPAIMVGVIVNLLLETQQMIDIIKKEFNVGE